MKFARQRRLLKERERKKGKDAIEPSNMFAKR